MLAAAHRVVPIDERLPPELLSHVCSFLRPQHLVPGAHPLRPDYSPLLALARVNRTWHRAALPHLVWSVVLGTPRGLLLRLVQAGVDSERAEPIIPAHVRIHHLHVHPLTHRTPSPTRNDGGLDLDRLDVCLRILDSEAGSSLQTLTLHITGTPEEHADARDAPVEARASASAVVGSSLSRAFIKQSGSHRLRGPRLERLLDHLQNLTHLHLCGVETAWDVLLRPAEHDDDVGSVRAFPALEQLRLSLLPAETLHDFQRYVVLRNEQRRPGAPPPAFPGGRRVVRAKALLYLVAAEMRRGGWVRRLLLELSPLARLEEPSWVDDWRRDRARVDGRGASSAGARADDVVRIGLDSDPEQFSTAGAGAPFYESDGPTPGQLVTMDFPADVVLDAAEAARREADEERSRTALRDQYWMCVREGREALAEWAGAGAPSAAAAAAAAATATGRGLVATTTNEVRVCAARECGWNLHETEREHWANVRAADDGGGGGGGPADGARRERGEERPSYDDEDVFAAAARAAAADVEGFGVMRYGYEMVERGSDRGRDGGESEVRDGGGGGERRWYWTGQLPRVNASVPT